MADYTLYHNPRCSKSRIALAALQDAGKDVEEIRYLDTPLTEDELRRLFALLDVPLREAVRTKEAPYKENGLKDADDDALIAAIASHPVLLQRPIVVHGDKAVIARTPEALASLL
ncbi:MAG: arsenate reductase (glutaredoxin) [Rickettsiales bacterium]|nr:arsenate reductase (glutaredoxin) [Rickettsiales bacterium]|tara:strand:+ start:352 stop:696 length:345 start_codon:yes stop_codon:yes gene_type:complete